MNKCIFCDAKAGVKYSRLLKDGRRSRRYECLKGHTFFTIEDLFAKKPKMLSKRERRP